MPLYLANEGEEFEIRHIGGNPEVKQHLTALGFVVGDKITVVSSIGGNLIVKVKDSRVALDKELASKISI